MTMGVIRRPLQIRLFRQTGMISIGGMRRPLRIKQFSPIMLSVKSMMREMLRYKSVSRIKATLLAILSLVRSFRATNLVSDRPQTDIISKIGLDCYDLYVSLTFEKVTFGPWTSLHDIS